MQLTAHLMVVVMVTHQHKSFVLSSSDLIADFISYEGALDLTYITVETTDQAI